MHRAGFYIIRPKVRCGKNGWTQIAKGGKLTKASVRCEGVSVHHDDDHVVDKLKTGAPHGIGKLLPASVLSPAIKYFQESKVSSFQKFSSSPDVISVICYISSSLHVGRFYV